VAQFVIVLAGEPKEEQVFEVRRKDKYGGLEITVLRNGFTAMIARSDIIRSASEAEIKKARELGKANRQPCPKCNEPMTVHLGPFGLMPWRCEQHGEPK
jgi:ATP phosphoribosyltransferase regulatory subunit HisZ